MTTTINKAFTTARGVNASIHDLASSLAIIIWREMNNWGGNGRDRDFIRMHNQSRLIQDEIRIMSNGIRLILEVDRKHHAQRAREIGYEMHNQCGDLGRDFSDRTGEMIAEAIERSDE